ncbi:hypothetical protein ABZZ47_39175 [Streptomyces sp. NPDC006465]|uniref:hypothetical protein n=1 Tax=Streptomyces sp. NPDC006465 TaxID=3157174 RepID=UPI0033BE25A5
MGRGRHLWQGKNLAGAYEQAAAVLCDADCLATLPARERTEACAPTLTCGAQVPNGRRGGSSACCVGFPKLRRQREHPGCSWTDTHQRRESREPREFRPRGSHRRYRRRLGHPQWGDRQCADRRPAGSR